MCDVFVHYMLLLSNAHCLYGESSRTIAFIHLRCMICALVVTLHAYDEYVQHVFYCMFSCYIYTYIHTYFSEKTIPIECTVHAIMSASW